MKYYIIVDSKTAGPFELNQVKALYDNGNINDHSMYSTQESADWMPVSFLKPLFNVNPHSNIPPQIIPSIIINNSNTNTQNINPNEYTLSRKSRFIYQFLGFFFGILGIHNFYVGRYTYGVIQLCISIFSGGTLAVICMIWAWIEIFTVRKDGWDIIMK